MKKTFILVLTILMIFLYIISPAFSNEKDSVNWDNINLNYKPPKVDSDKKEEQDGFFIPVISDADFSKLSEEVVAGANQVNDKTNLDKKIPVSDKSEDLLKTNKSKIPNSTLSTVSSDGHHPKSQGHIQFADEYLFGTFDPGQFQKQIPIDTAFGKDDGIGEQYGLGGPILVCIKVKRECGISVMDSDGVFLGTVTKKKLKKDPKLTERLLTEAEKRSRIEFLKAIKHDLIFSKLLGSNVVSPSEAPKLSLHNDSNQGNPDEWNSGGNTDPDNSSGGNPEDWNSDEDNVKQRKSSDTRSDIKKRMEELNKQSTKLEDQIKQMEKGLKGIPENGDSMAQAMRKDLQDNIDKTKKKLNQVTREVMHEGYKLMHTKVQSNAMKVTPPSTSDDALVPTEENTRLENGGQNISKNGFSLQSNWDRIFPKKLNNNAGIQQPTNSNSVFPYNPTQVMVPLLGQSQEYINGLANDINANLFGRRTRCTERCFNIFIDRPGIYIIEDVFGRVVLRKRKKEPKVIIDPNDPLFKYVKKKKKKLLGFLGSSTKIGLSIMGGTSGVGGSVGVSVGGNNKKPNVRDQWGLHRIGYTQKSDLNSAWNVIDGRNKNIIVALIDSGIDMSHPDNDKDDDGNGYVDDINGWNFLDNNNDLTDLRGHGTFVAGIIAAKTNNGEGIAGINPGAQIMMLKVTDKNGHTNSLNIYRAIKYAVNKGARVINISLGGKGISKLEQLAINYAYKRGVFVVVASGNTGDYMGDVGPAYDKGAFVVGAIDYSGQRSMISSRGPNNALLAPGEEIYSLHSKDAPWEGGSVDKKRMYFKASGTSFSAPMVTATASLILAKNPDLTNDDIEEILLGTASDMDDEGWDWKTGAGLLNASSALRADPDKLLVLKIVNFRINRDKKGKLESVDVFATVKGKVLDNFTVGLAKGKRAKRFKKVSGPFLKQANNDWVARINKDKLRGSKYWLVNITAIDKTGHKKTAKALLRLK